MPNAFSTLGLHDALTEALARMDFVEMTPIQAAALPAILEGADVRGQASTGSGKTAAFGLGLLQAIDPQQSTTQALVLCPTRELAEQVAAELRKLAQVLNTRVATAVGGRPYRDQTRALQSASPVVVGTPGRINKHLLKGSLTLADLRVLVLDEADRMLDMGFVDQVSEIVAQCPADRQTLLFSATFPEGIAALSASVQRDPQVVTVGVQVEPEQLRQLVFECEPVDRFQTVADLLATYRPASSLVFCETRDDCEALTSWLTHLGARARTLHGQMEQRDRDDVLLQLTNGSASVLVATDVAARGLDIPALPVVIAAELSRDPQSHVHRIGRTGRASEAGLALSIAAGAHERERLARIEAITGPIERGPPLTHAEDLRFLDAPNRTLMLLAGRKDKLRKSDVLGALVKDAGIPIEAIGRIDTLDRATAVAIARDRARQALTWVEQGKIKKRRIRALLLS